MEKLKISDDIRRKLEFEFGEQWEVITTSIKGRIAAICGIMRLLDDKSFSILNKKCSYFQKRIDMKTISKDEKRCLIKELEKTFRELENKYKNVGVKNWPVSILRGKELTKEFWSNELDNERKRLREIGEKNDFIKRKIESFLEEAGLETSAKLGGKQETSIASGQPKIRGGPQVFVMKAKIISKDAARLISQSLNSIDAIRTSRGMVILDKAFKNVAYSPRMIFNAGIFTDKGEKIWSGNLFLGKETILKLKKASLTSGAPLYVVRGPEIPIAESLKNISEISRIAVLKVNGEKAEIIYHGLTGDIAIPV